MKRLLSGIIFALALSPVAIQVSATHHSASTDVVVPDVVGMKLGAAEVRLTAAHLQTQTVQAPACANYVVTSQGPDGIIGQTDAGSTVPVGTSIPVVVQFPLGANQC
jgi:beta-lactam-binding protein with PASTA domain